MNYRDIVVCGCLFFIGIVNYVIRIAKYEGNRLSYHSAPLVH